MKITVQPFKQEGVQMFSGVASARKLLKVCKVDEWDPQNEDGGGYQRAPERSRTGKLAKYLANSNNPLLPSSILLSHRGSIATRDVGNGMLELEIAAGAILWVVDGQHRLYGIQRAIEEDGLQRLADYQLPIVIVEFKNVEEEAHQFRIINETMKKVRTDLARRLLAAHIATKSGKKEVQNDARLWEANAVTVLSVLTKQGAPFESKVQPPNSRKTKDNVIRELSFVTSLKPILTTWPYNGWAPDRVGLVLSRYWAAWKKMIPDAFENPKDYVLLKTPGAFSLHLLARDALEALRREGIAEPQTEDFLKILEKLEAPATADYWKSDNADGAAMAGSMKGFALLAAMMRDEIEVD
jgi:DGQHR domain-containing protein